VGLIDDSRGAPPRALGPRWGLGRICGRPGPILQEQRGEQRREGDGCNHRPQEHNRCQCGRQGKQRPRGVARLGTSENEVGSEGARRKARQNHPPGKIVHAHLLRSFARPSLIACRISAYRISKVLRHLGYPELRPGTLGYSTRGRLQDCNARVTLRLRGEADVVPLSEGSEAGVSS
jgi:hypothetical protein